MAITDLELTRTARACFAWVRGLSLFSLGLFSFLAVISTQILLQLCQSEACEDQFANYTDPQPDDKCLGTDQHTGEKVHVMRSDCTEV